MVPLGYSDDMSWDREMQDMWVDSHKYIVLPSHADDRYLRMLANGLTRTVVNELSYANKKIEINGTDRGIYYPIRDAVQRALATMIAAQEIRVESDL